MLQRQQQILDILSTIQVGICKTLSGFVPTLVFLFLTLVFVEIVCVLLLQLIFLFTWDTKDPYHRLRDDHGTGLDNDQNLSLRFSTSSALDERQSERQVPEYHDDYYCTNQIPITKALLDTALITTKCSSKLLLSEQIRQHGTHCAICLSEFELNDGISKSKTCNHGFHAACYKKWLQIGSGDCKHHHSCPYCRQDIFNAPQLIYREGWARATLLWTIGNTSNKISSEVELHSADEDFNMPVPNFLLWAPAKLPPRYSI